MNGQPRIVGATIIAALTQVAIAADNAPPSRPHELAGEGTLRFQPAVGLRMGEYFVRFEQTTLAEVVAAVGVGSIERGTQDHGSSYYICLTDASTARPHRFWIMSNAEMGGPERAVTKVVAESRNVSPTAECPQVPDARLPIALDRGLWIGTTSAQLRAKLGGNSGRRGEWLTYNYLGTTTRMRGGSVTSFDVTNVVEARLRDGRIDAIAASRVTSH